MTKLEDLGDRLRRGLSQLDLSAETEWTARPAAVLLPLFREHGEWNLLYTRRTESVDVHSGQVSFPGGSIEPGDGSATQAALREAQEEIGLRPGDVEVLGQLNPLLTVSQFLVSPVVGIIPWPYELERNQSEVSRFFGVPIKWLADEKNVEARSREPLIPGRPIQVYYFKEYDGELIWGVTARITLSFLELAASVTEPGEGLD